jgi:hypothetical protein
MTVLGIYNNEIMKKCKLACWRFPVNRSALLENLVEVEDDVGGNCEGC